MKLIKLAVLFLAIIIMNNANADPNYDKIFTGVEPCFTLYDLDAGKTVASYNIDRCKERMSPCSTFKIPLSLIGFDSGILKDENNPLWKYKPEYGAVLESQAKDQTPKSWMVNSVVWYSKNLTQKLGMDKFKSYVTKFSYGNQDLSGNPGKNDGLTQSWLGSSLKVSANEQIDFLKKFITYKLPVSKEAIDHTKNIIFIEELPNGWKIYGRTGSGWQKNQDGREIEDMGFGWFVGYLEKKGKIYIFATNIFDKEKSTEFAGRKAKAMSKEIFANLDILK